MTGPRFPDYNAQLGIGSDLYKTEWDQYMARHRQLVDQLFQEIQGLGARSTFADVASGSSSTQPGLGYNFITDPADANRRPAGIEELLGQAHYWGIPGAESMSPDQLYQEIQARRAGVERPPETTLGSVGAAGVGAFAGASESLARVAGNIMGLVGDLPGMMKQLPFAETTLSKVLGVEKAKQWLQDVARNTESYVEWAKAVQPQQDRTAADVMIGTGKVAGYALPAFLAWEGMGALGASETLAPWSARISSPFLRSAIQGAATGTLLEAGSDEDAQTKALNIGLGTVLGFATALPRIGAMIGLGGLGAGVGAQVGQTAEERRTNMLIGGVGGALLPLSPIFLKAASKVRTDFAGPMDRAVTDVVAAEPMGYQGPRRPVQAEGRIVGQPALPGGPDYEVMPPEQLPNTAQDLTKLLVRSEPPTTPEQVLGLGAPPQRPRLMDPERATTTHELFALGDEMVGAQWAAQDPALAPSAHDWMAEIRSKSENLRGTLYGLPPGPEYPRPVPMHLEGTKVVDANGAPLVVYHGTGTEFESFDLSKADPDALYGPGFYHTEDPAIASGYAGQPGAPALFAMPGVPSSAPLDLIRTPQVKPARLNIQNPFDIDAPVDSNEANRLLDAIDSQFSQSIRGSDHYSDYQNALSHYRTELNASDSPFHTNEHLYDLLVNMGAMVHRALADTYQGPLQRSGEYGLQSIWTESSQMSAKLLATDFLKQAGYDGITHIGGAITGSPPHRVWIAFDPGQVHSPWDTPDLTHADAVAQAQAISKQATIMESPNLAADTGKMQLTDQDVVNAAEVVNPAGVSVIKGIDPTRWGEGTLREFLNRRGSDITFVEKGGKLDALVGKVDPIHVEQYKKYGMFQGQRVVTTSGLEGTILNPSTAKGRVVIAREGGPPMTFNREKILPSRFSAPQIEVPDLWNSFKADILSYLNTEAGKAGQPGIQSIFDPRASGLLHERMYDFFDRMGINDPALRQGLDESFTRQYAREAKDLDPEMRDLQAAILDQAVQAHNAVEESSRPIPVSMEEAAQAKGFIWVTKPGDGGTFHDTINPGTPAIPVETDQAAQAFLANVDRTLPDVTPSSDTPLEVADFAPTESNLEPRATPEDMEDSLQNTLEDFNQSSDPGYGAVGGGGTPPGLPPSPPVGGGGGALPPGQYNMGPVPPPPETIGGQFARLQGHDPLRYANLQEYFKSSVMMRLHYTRYGMLHMENKLTDAGVTLGRAWDMWNDLEVARTKAHTEALPWLNQYGAIMKMYPRRILRDGTAARIHEIEDPNARYAAFYRLGETHGYSQAKIQRVIRADGQLTDFFNRIGSALSDDPAINLSHDRLIFRYLPMVRARQAQELPDPYQVGSLPSDLQFFGEHIREGNIQTRIMDLRELGTYYVRAAYAKKYEAEPWQNLVTAWQDSRIPEGIRNYVLDAARLIRYGYDARGELAVRGMRSVMGKFGIPISTREAQRLLGVPQGAMYMSLLAGRMSIFFRDAIQPLLTLTKVPTGTVQGVYRDVLKGLAGDRAGLAEMYHRALDGGWVQKENPNIENVGLFEQDAAVNQDLAALTPAQAGRRESIARVGDFIYDLPDWLARPSQSPVNTLRWYGKLGQTNRMIAGEVGYRYATEQLSNYRRSAIEAAIAGAPDQAIPYNVFADKSGFSSWEKPIQRKLQELVQSGDDEGAAQLYARELANMTQFRYGRSEMPPALRGTVGRMLFSFSNFTGQYAELLGSVARNGTPYSKVKAAMAMGAVAAALYTLKAETGWSFDKWVWGQAFQYTGGPLAERLVRGAAAYMGGVGRLAGDRPVPSYQTEALKAEGQGSLLGDIADYFPYTGYIRSAAEYGAAAQGTNPWEQAIRYTVTGDRGSRIDLQRMLEQAGPFPPGSLSPNGGQMPGTPGERRPPAPNPGFPPGHFPEGGGFRQ